MKTFTLSFLLSLSAAVFCMPVSQPTQQDEQFAENYLKRFFNLTEERGPSFRSGISSVSDKLMEMQKFFGLHITGNLDADTLAMMKKPRCGVPDVDVAQFSTFGNNLYSGPYMYEFSLRTGRLLRLLRNSYFLPCTNY